MHSILELGANVPAFLAKLWRLVDDPDTNDLICWSEDGTSFYIRDQAQFSRKLLPMYYKHNNMASFIRQLNMYGFHKIVAADAGSLRLDRDEMEFAHQCFLRGHPYLLEHIKRKNQLLSNKQLDESRVSSSGGTVVRADIMNKLLNEVKHMRGRQETVETRLSNMKQENEALWRELSLLRQKHMKQQTIVNKLIQFLVTLVQPSQRLNPKRRLPLMLNNVPHPTSDTKTGSKGRSDFAETASNGSQGRRLFTVVLPSTQAQSTSGAVIHEVDSDMISGDGDELLNPPMTLEDPDDDLAGLTDTDDLSSSVILGELTDNLAAGDTLTLIPTEDSDPQDQVLDSDILLGVDPSEVNPAIIVPGLQKRKIAQKTVNQVQRVGGSGAAPVTRSQGARSADVSRGSASEAANIARKDAAAAVEKAVAAIKKEPRITSNRSRRRKVAAAKTEAQPAVALLPQPQQTMDTVDLLAEVGLVSPSPAQMASEPDSNVMEGSPMSGAGQVPSPLAIFQAPSPARSPMSPHDRPYSTDLALACAPQTQDNGGNGNVAPAVASASTQAPSADHMNREQLDGHCESLDSELGQLKDLLHNSGFSLDASTLLGLFNPDDSLPFNPQQGSDGKDPLVEDPMGNELMMYSQPDMRDVLDFSYFDRRPDSSSPPPLGDGCDINTPVLTPASPGFNAALAEAKRRKV